MTEQSYTVLGFETDIFGKSVWRLDDIAKVSNVIKLAQENDALLVSYREKGDEADLSQLKTAGFYPVETLTTLEKSLDQKADWPDHIRLATVEDANVVAELARHCFTYDRYHADDAIDNHLADEIKARWMYNSVNGRADAVFLYEVDHKILGFNACMFKDGQAIIDLIGVSPESQGKGVGQALVDAMAAHYYGKADRLKLGTQEANIKSQNFYKKLGFEQVAAHTTWHWTSKV